MLFFFAFYHLPCYWRIKICKKTGDRRVHRRLADINTATVSSAMHYIHSCVDRHALVDLAFIVQKCKKCNIFLLIMDSPGLHRPVTYIFSQPSIYIDGWLYAMSMTSVVCNVPVLSQNDSTYHHSVFTT